ncbi:50S ribosomal protein L6 [Candidatus Woesearchaeota archaeon]|nr:50S ribosomal protein L6 [Candidatus Woesearchaeota archaeon]
MAKRDIEEIIELPEDIKVEENQGVYSVSGPKGQVKRAFRSPNIEIKLEKDKIILLAKNASKKHKAILNTYRAHLKNIINGVNQGYTYKLKICSGHFPMNVSFSNNILSIKNFIGEKIPRTVEIDPRVDVKVQGDFITLEGLDKELVGQAAADIEQLTRRPGYDKRIFQDGIFIIEKAGKKLVK